MDFSPLSENSDVVKRKNKCFIIFSYYFSYYYRPQKIYKHMPFHSLYSNLIKENSLPFDCNSHQHFVSLEIGQHEPAQTTSIVKMLHRIIWTRNAWTGV